MKRYLTIGVREMSTEDVVEMCTENVQKDGTGYRIKHRSGGKSLTVEQVLRRQGGFTKRQISHAKFLPEGILKNGKPCRVTEKVRAGDRIGICLEGTEEKSAHLVDGEGQLDILYEDEDLLAVNKPAGLVTHPQGRHYQDSLANQVAAYFRGKKEEHSIRPIGRLDQDTSGIVIFAKNKAAAARLQEQRENGIFSKTYLAVVRGMLPADGKVHRIETFMMQDAKDKRKMVTVPGDTAVGGNGKQGKRAVTYYRVLENTEKYSVALLTLETGRTHQIRVHMAEMRHPLVGDPLYGQESGRCPEQEENGRAPAADRALLHAWKVELQQPFSGNVIRLTAPITEDIKKASFQSQIRQFPIIRFHAPASEEYQSGRNNSHL